MDPWALLLLLSHVIVGFVAAVAVSVNRRPASAIAWILTIIFIPFLGLLAFLLIGVGRLPRRRRAIQQHVSELMAARSDVLALRIAPTRPSWLSFAVQLNENLGALPMLSGNAAHLIEGYEESIAAMVDDIDGAEEYVHVEFYILVLDGTTRSFFDALARATARGVPVRVLSDHVAGFLSPYRKETRVALREMGAEWHPMLPLRPLSGQWQRPDLRNHRKLLVVDGVVGHTGSQNLIDDSYHKPISARRGLHWKELMVRLEGPVVAELDAVFVTDWFSETGKLLPLVGHPEAAIPDAGAPHAGKHAVIDAQVVPSGPSFENDNNLKLFVLLIQSAQQRVSITSPYFVPEESTLLAILTAAARGVDVELFVSAIGDQFLVYHAQRSYYEVLLRAGVAIYLYREPTVLHSKHFSIDDDVAVIGTSNMDIRSFSLNMELSLLVRGRAFVDRMRAVEDSYRANSDALTLADWSRRPLRAKVRDNLARLTSSLQ
ncbi:cardiolipin synthase [Microbacterium sp. DT81.1]|uniref:cardiolipin synthase n=1 Tax=Microbacterium sp. DT81.1 TaxID=3393413 RepID=UPI003CE8F090